MQEFSSISVSAYEPADLTNQLNEQSAAGWSVVSIVTTGSTVTAYLSREGTGASSGDGVSASSSSNDWSASADAGGTDDAGNVVAAVYTTDSVATDVVTADSVGYAVVDSAGDVVGAETGWVASGDAAAVVGDATQSVSAFGAESTDPTPHVGTPSHSEHSGHQEHSSHSEHASHADHASHAASSVTDHASHAAASAGDHASHAASSAADHASHAAASAGDQASQSAADQTAQAGTVVSSEVGAAAAVSAVAPPGWYTDPSGRFELRYWDGGQWTEHVSRNSQQFTDPPVA